MMELARGRGWISSVDGSSWLKWKINEFVLEVTMPSLIVQAQELRQDRAEVVTQARQILDTAEAEDRALTEEEEQNYDRAMNDAQDLLQRAERLERQETLERDLGEPQDDGAPRPDPDDPDGNREFNYQFQSRGMQVLNEADPVWRQEPLWQRLFPFARDPYRPAFRGWLRSGQMAPEARALQADLDTVGGFLITPMQFVDRLIKAVDNYVYMRQWATVFAVPRAESLGAPSLENDPADPVWTAELAIGDEDNQMEFGRRELHPHPLAKYIKISRKLLRQVPDVESLVIQRLAYKFGVVGENAYLHGDGAGQPLGVFTASDDGIPTSRDVSTGNTTTEIKFDGLIETKYTLKPQYWPRAKWLFHRDGQKQIAKLKDSEGQYIWRESVRVGEPDRILGLPTFMSEYAPNTFTTGLYVGILGDFSNYWIADALSMEMQRLVELFAATNQIGLVGRLESDGMPVLGEAFVRVQLA